MEPASSPQPHALELCEDDAQRPAIPKVLFKKAGVFVCPNPNSIDSSIGGILQILQVHSKQASGETVLQWTSYASLRKHLPDLSMSSSFLDLGTGETVQHRQSPKPSSGAPARSTSESDNVSSPQSYEITVPLHNIHSIKRVTPALGGGTPYIIITTSLKVALPPLYFTTGGLKELFASLKQVAILTRSDDDSNLFLLNDTDGNDLVKSMTTLMSTTAVSASKSSAASFLSDFGMSILEKFSRVPKLGRRALKSISEEPSKEHDIRKPSSIHYSLGEFELVDDGDDHAIELPQVQREAPLSASEWSAAFDSEGRVTNSAEVRRRIFKGGADSSIRREVWKFLLGFYPWNSTRAARQALLQQKSSEYQVYKGQWQSITAEQENHFQKFRNRRSRVGTYQFGDVFHIVVLLVGETEKDVARTDRDLELFKHKDSPALVAIHNILMSYIFFNFDVGYVQGMNDLVSPIYLVMPDEAEAFWCFKCYMDGMASNFDKDQQGMTTHFLQLERLLRCIDPQFHQYLQHANCLNMFFVYRWILINFKREFSIDDVMLIWEAIWSNYLHPRFHLFVALAMLLTARGEIISQRMGFDMILQCMNTLSGKLSASDILERAEALFRNFDARTDDEVKQSVFLAAPRQERQPE